MTALWRPLHDRHLDRDIEELARLSDKSGKVQKWPFCVLVPYLRRLQDEACFAAKHRRSFRLPSSGQLAKLTGRSRSWMHKYLVDEWQDWADPRLENQWAAMRLMGLAWSRTTETQSEHIGNTLGGHSGLGSTVRLRDLVDMGCTVRGHTQDVKRDRRVWSLHPTLYILPSSLRSEETQADHEGQPGGRRAKKKDPLAWVTKVRARGKHDPVEPPRTLTRKQMVEVFAHALEPVRRSDSGDLSASACMPVWAVWRAMSNHPQANGVFLDMERARKALRLLAEAAQDCEHHYFRNDIRGLRANGTSWRVSQADRPGAVFRLEPRSDSGGATWLDRLRVARDWAKARDAGPAALDAWSRENCPELFAGKARASPSRPAKRDAFDAYESILSTPANNPTPEPQDILDGQYECSDDRNPRPLLAGPAQPGGPWR